MQSQQPKKIKGRAKKEQAFNKMLQKDLYIKMALPGVREVTFEAVPSQELYTIFMACQFCQKEYSDHSYLMQHIYSRHSSKWKNISKEKIVPPITLRRVAYNTYEIISKAPQKCTNFRQEREPQK